MKLNKNTKKIVNKVAKVVKKSEIKKTVKDQAAPKIVKKEAVGDLETISIVKKLGSFLGNCSNCNAMICSSDCLNETQAVCPACGKKLTLKKLKKNVVDPEDRPKSKKEYLEHTIASTILGNTSFSSSPKDDDENVEESDIPEKE